MENADGNSITTSGIPAEDRYGHEPIEKFDNGLREMPQEYRGKFFNACTDPCDMLIGPCACGAWHYLKDWQGKIEPVEKSNKVKPLAQYLAEYLATGIDRTHKAGMPMDFTEDGLKSIFEQALDAYKDTESDKVKLLAKYLDEYIEHEVEDGTISSGVAELYAYNSWRELLEQALDAYESTENVKIKIEKQ